MAIKFNSVNHDIFNCRAAEFAADAGQQRAKLITCGRMLMADNAGKSNDAMRQLMNKPTEYTAMLSAQDYAKTNRNFKEKMMLFAASRACAISGENAPSDYGEFMRDQRRYLSDKTFLKVLQGIVRDIVSPLLPITMSNALDWIAETVSVPLGKTYELDIMSNDVFLFEDDSWGASRSKPSNYLYSQPITLNPTLRTAKATIKWYQLVGNDVDMGRFFNSIAAGLYSKITAMAMAKMTAATSDTTIVPANLQFTNTSQNFVTAANRVAMVNGTYYRNTVAIGHPTALAAALPSGMVNASSVNLDAALATLLGVEWARYGYLGEYMGIRMMPLQDAVVPGTQNTSITGVIPTNKIWIMPMGGYRPIYVGMEEGTPITVELNPSETADMTIDIIVSASLDAQPVFGNKIAVITV